LATFSQWLDAQSQRSDEVGRVALTWANAAPDGIGKIKRPRASAPKTIMSWFLSEPDIVPDMTPKRVQDVLIAAVAQYHTGSHGVGPALPSPPLGPDLQPARLASVPGHQQADPATDGVSAAQALPDQMMAVMADRIAALDERLAGMQELITGIGQQVSLPPDMAKAVSLVPAIHELLVAFMQAMAPVIELGEELQASDRKLAEAQQLADMAAAGDLGEQLGVTLSDAQRKAQETARQGFMDTQAVAREIAQANGWLPPAEMIPAGPEHARADVPAPQATTGQGMRLYGAHIAPEPHMTRLYELGEAVDD
jgi:hypothetical protein